MQVEEGTIKLRFKTEELTVDCLHNLKVIGICLITTLIMKRVDKTKI